MICLQLPAGHIPGLSLPAHLLPGDSSHRTFKKGELLWHRPMGMRPGDLAVEEGCPPPSASSSEFPLPSLKWASKVMQSNPGLRGASGFQSSAASVLYSVFPLVLRKVGIWEKRQPREAWSRREPLASPCVLFPFLGCLQRSVSSLNPPQSCSPLVSLRGCLSVLPLRTRSLF